MDRISYFKQIKDNAADLYIRLREKFDSGVEMQLNYDELEEYARKSRITKRERYKRLCSIAARQKIRRGK